MTNNPDVMFPRPEILELMSSGVISEPVTTAKYVNGKPEANVSTRIVEGGSGQAGLKDSLDMVEWSGMPNHIFLSTRIAVEYSVKAKQAGYDVDPELVLNAGIGSHLGRRPWDEANWYRDLVINWQDTLSQTNETLGVGMLESANIDKRVIKIVQGLGHGVTADTEIYQTLEYKIFALVDHMVTEAVNPYENRMSGFLAGAFMPGQKPDESTIANIKSVITDAFANPAEARAESIYSSFLNLGANRESDRLSLARFAELIVEDANTARLLNDIGVDLSKADQIPEASWEKILRACFLQDSEKDAFQKFEEIDQRILDPVDAEHSIPFVRDNARKYNGFNTSKWGYKAMQERYEQAKGTATEPFLKDENETSIFGWQAAIYLAKYFANQKE